VSYFTLSCALRRFASSHGILTATILIGVTVAFGFMAPAHASSLWSGSATPSTPDYPSSTPDELGVKFYSDVSGTVTAIRFYKGVNNTGTHVGHLWDSNGHLLATATFTNESASGWQQVSLATPVQIQANTVYIASYWDPHGNNASDQHYFTSQYNNAPLHAVSGPNGVYNYDASSYPASSYASTNYWVDVAFTPNSDPSPSPSSNASLWTPSATPGTPDYPASIPYELGVKFYSDVAGAISAIRFYKGVNNTGAHVAHLWDSNGKLLSTATFTNETASGWQQVNLPAPVQIQANTVYIASYWDPNGNNASQQNYFTSQYNNPPLHAVAGSNGVYNYNASAYPAGSYASTNYWVDVVFTPATSSGSGGGGSGTMLLSGSPTNLSFGDVTLGAKSTLPFVITNTGSESVTISQATAGGAGFSIAGPSLPLTLTAGQNTSFSISFTPAAAGSVTGAVSVVSNATNSPTASSLTATGANKHSVTLSWAPSTSQNITGYNVYRGSASGGPYSKINSSPVGITTYTDGSVQAAQTYYYVATAVDSAGVESAYSNQVLAAVPSP
jgi:hypothetical protein